MWQWTIFPAIVGLLLTVTILLIFRRSILEAIFAFYHVFSSTIKEIVSFRKTDDSPYQETHDDDMRQGE